MRRALTCLSLVTLRASTAFAQARGCSTPLASPSVTIMLPGSPFGVVPSRDGCWVFASISGPTSGIAVLKRQDGHIDLVRVVPVQPAPAGIALTHDGQLLAAAATNSAVVLDVNAMTAGTGNPIVGTFSGTGAKFVESV